MDQIFCMRRLLEERAEFGLPVAVAALDFSAAYDAVDKERLWKVLELGVGQRNVARVEGLRREDKMQGEGGRTVFGRV